MKRNIVFFIAAHLVSLVLYTGCSEPPAGMNDSQADSKTTPVPAVAEKAPAPQKPAVVVEETPKAIAWAKDWDAAKKVAAERRQLVMIDFYTDWCGWCKRLDRDTFPNPEVIKIASKFVAVKLDAGREGRTLAQQYNVRSYPTILFVDGEGKLVARIGGYMPPAPFAEKLKEIQKDHVKS